jgi:hypothetical protein
MLFRKKMPKTCLHCLHATVKSETEIHCAKRGVRTSDSPCLRYKYDPCKRIPPRPKALDFNAYNEDDFSL